MQYRAFGSTGLKISAVGVGCMNFGWHIDASAADAIVGAALDEGINFFDTSVSYGRGISEEMLGRSLRSLDTRGEALVATKFGSAASDDVGVNGTGNSRWNIIRQCETSLRRLKRDHIDIYQLHKMDDATPFEETFRALDMLARDGKIRYIGVCNLSGWRLVEALWCTRMLGLLPIVSSQNRLNLLHQQSLNDAMAAGRRFGLANIAYAPLAEGLLTGKYKKNVPFPPPSRFHRASAANNYKERLTDAVQDVVDRLMSYASSTDVDLASLSLAWMFNQPSVDCSLVGVSNADQVKTTALALDIQMSAGDLVCLAELVLKQGEKYNW